MSIYPPRHLFTGTPCCHCHGTTHSSPTFPVKTVLAKELVYPMKIKLSLVTSETKNWQIHQSWRKMPELIVVFVQFRLECQPLILGISINIYIYSTVQNIKVLPPVVNKKAVIILNFHGAGERGRAAERRSQRRFVRAIEHAKNAHTSSKNAHKYIFIHNSGERGLATRTRPGGTGECVVVCVFRRRKITHHI